MRRRARAGQTKRCSNAGESLTSWLQAMSMAPQEHAQVTTAVWGTMVTESRQDSVGKLKPEAHRYAGLFQGDLEFFQEHLWHGDLFFRSGTVTGERCLKLVMQMLNSVCMILVFSVWRSGWVFPHSCCRIETCERRNWEEFCVPSDDKRRETRRRTVAEQESAACVSVVVFSLGWPLAVVRSNECLWCRSLFASVGPARQRMREADEMGHCRVDGRDSQMASCDERWRVAMSAV